MNMKTSKGFGLVEVVVAVVVLAVVVGAGFVFIQGMNKGKSEADSSSHHDDQNHADMMVDWKTYTSEAYGFSFQYPADWQVTAKASAAEPDRINTVVQNADGQEVLGLYGYLGTGCESTPSGTEPKSKVTVVDTTVTVAKDCNDNWSWITADTAKGGQVTITTWDFLGKPTEDDALMLLDSAKGLTNIKANVVN